MRPSVAILCGGRGARLQEHTQSIPKPLVQVGGRPILWHVISIHIRQGFSDFLLLTGYRGDPAYASPRAGDIRDSLADIRLAGELLGYAPRVGFEEGLRRTVEWYRSTSAERLISQSAVT